MTTRRKRRTQPRTPLLRLNRLETIVGVDDDRWPLPRGTEAPTLLELLVADLGVDADTLRSRLEEMC